MAPHAEGSVGHADGFNVQTASAKDLFVVNSPNVQYTEDTIKTKYTYRTTDVTQNADGKYVAVPKETLYDFKVDRKIPKVGVMLVGLGGNNGTTVTAGIIANKRNLVWETKEGKRAANYYGSVIMSSTTKLGVDSKTGKEIYVPFLHQKPSAFLRGHSMAAKGRKVKSAAPETTDGHERGKDFLNEAEVQRLTPERRAKDLEGVADLLRMLGDLTPAEVVDRGGEPAWLVELEGGGHMPLFEFPDRLNQELETLFAEADEQLAQAPSAEEQG